MERLSIDRLVFPGGAPVNHKKSSRERANSQGFWKDNGLTIALLALFLAALIGQSIAGLRVANQTRAGLGASPIPYLRYLSSANFLEDIFENTQAAVLQLASIVVFGIFLRQRGAAHSRTDRPTHNSPQESHRFPWLYSHSLSVVLALLFVLFFSLHLAAGSAADEAERALRHQPPLSFFQFALSAKFWVTTFQTWQAEYFAMALYLILSIFLRQDRSPESKPVQASNQATGETSS